MNSRHDNRLRSICFHLALLLSILAPAAVSGQDESDNSRYEIRLGGQRFVPGETEPQISAAWRMPPRTNENPDFYLIQLKDATRQATVDQIKSYGLKIVQYIHPNTYVVWGRPAEGDRAGRDLNAIRWAGEFQPNFRVARSVATSGRETETVQVLIYRLVDIEAVLQEFRRAGGMVKGQEVIDDKFVLAEIDVPTASVPRLARISGVYSIQGKPTDGGLRSEMSSQINAGNVNGNLAVVGYEAWLGGLGLDGSGVIIANVDGGVDNDHPDLQNRLVPCTGSTCQNALESNHGTHTASIMAGDGSSGETDDNGFLRGLGVAPGASLVEQNYVNFMTPAGMSLLMTESHRNGAYISGNSWGPSGSPQGYDASTRQVDVRVRDADPDETGNQYLFYVLSIMNGNGGTSTQGSPDEAKNLFTIGSTKLRKFDASQDLDIDDISSNSAHGPCLDGRTIPHMLAPGCRIDACYTGGGHGLMCGTSMASPQVSGAAALFVQRYRQLTGNCCMPSPALIKAAFIAVAKDLAGNKDADGSTLGHPFDSKQGWGRMDLRAVLDVDDNTVQYFDEPVLLSDTGETWTTNLAPADPTRPVRIMLVWTDAPGHGLGGDTPAWNNNLDLEVQVGAKTYLGNVFGDDGFSATGGQADFRNNTEGVFLPSTELDGGAISVTVNAANINSDGVPNQGDETDQDFALVCYNCAASTPPDVDPTDPPLPPLVIEDPNELPMSRRLGPPSEAVRRATSEEAVAVGQKYYTSRSVCGPDTRQRIDPPTAGPEKATCCLVMKFPGSDSLYRGTGFIVAERLVATAGHCVFDDDLGGWAEWLLVIPGSNATSDQPFGSYFASYLHSVRGWTEQGDADYDYGAIEVASLDMQQAVQWNVDLHAADDAELEADNVHTIGYPVGKAPARSQWESRPATAVDSVLTRRIRYEFDTSGGNSGGPVFHGGAANRAVAIHTRGGCPNSGTRITPFRKRLILEDFNPDSPRWGGPSNPPNGEPDSARLDVDADTDRTGNIEGTAAEEDAEATRSVLVINNCDRDSPAGSSPDNADTIINGPLDAQDVEPLILRRNPGLSLSDVSLQIVGGSNDGLPLQSRIRVFGEDGEEVIGPDAGLRYVLRPQEIALLNNQDLKFHMEGLEFATSVTLRVMANGVEQDSLVVEVAPFLLTPHSLSPRENYVVRANIPISQQYVQSFKAACVEAGVEPVVVSSGDIWMEDELTWGYTESARRRLAVAMHMYRIRPLQSAIRSLLGPDVGWFQPFPYPSFPPPGTELHLNYGGNVEVSPPSPNHPFGRIYFGSHIVPDDADNEYIKRTFDTQLKEFFARQGVQDVVELHTNWLAVGHIDELVSFVPKSDGSCALLVSSPRLAYELLGQLNPNVDLDSKYAFEFGLSTVGDFFTLPTFQQTLEQYNQEVDRRIFGLDHTNPDPQSIVGVLQRELNLQAGDIIEVPTVFINVHGDIWSAVALTPGVVNLSSMGNHSLLPDPFLPAFRSRTETALMALGQTPKWIDNWRLYHANMGEVHCGSNELRSPFDTKWWE